MRFVLLLGLTIIAQRLVPNPDGALGMIALLIIVGLMDLVDFIMNIIKTFRR
jgi:hypothetical protein